MKLGSKFLLYYSHNYYEFHSLEMMFTAKTCLCYLMVCIFTSFSYVTRANNAELDRDKRQTRRICASDQFQCPSGQCISQNAVCNGIKNCLDGFDESWKACEQKHPHSCILPLQSSERSFNINCDSNGAINIYQSSEGDFVEELTLISFICNSGSEPNGRQFQSICLKGNWTPEYSDCLRSCPVINTQNANLNCYQNNKETDCKKRLLPGSVVEAKCAKNMIPNVEAQVCEKNGKWNVEKIECIGCGFKRSKRFPYQFPWTVAIFAKEILVLVCAAASCFMSHKGSNPDNYIVVTGKRKRAFHEDNAEFQHYYPIRSIILHENFQHKTFENDIAILHLSEKIIFNSGVYPVCIEWDEFKYYDLRNEDLGEIANFFVSEETANNISPLRIPIIWELLVRPNLQVEYITNVRCRNSSPEKVQHLLTEEKFCVRMPNDQPLILIDRGTGFFVKQRDDRYVLRGIANGIYSGMESYRVFTDFTKYLTWISKYLEPYIRPMTQLQDKKIDVFTKRDVFAYESLRINCSAGDLHVEFVDGCKLPSKNLFHIDYEVMCAENIFQGYCNRSTESAPIPQFTSLRYKCQNDYASYSQGVFESICFKGKWFPSIERCNKICETLKPENIQLLCSYQSWNFKCHDNLVVNTEVTASCLPGYKRSAMSNISSIFCKEDGQWSAPLLQCESSCGLSSKIEGREISPGDFPWNVIIYEKTSAHNLIGSATIISPYAIVSAAHFFYDSVNNIPKNSSYFEIAVSKITQDYKTHDSLTTQFYEIERLIFNNFKAQNHRYQQDIVIIVPKTKIMFNLQVSQICLFKDSSKEIPSGTYLDIPTWSIDEARKTTGSFKLQISHLPFIGYEECSRIAPSIVVEHLDPDKFCAGFINGTVLTGDNSGGIVLKNPSENSYYLVGIVSSKINKQIGLTLGTYVIKYLSWIRTQLDEIKKIKN